MEPISNYDSYSSGMKKSIKDKLFFEGLVEDVDTVIDYGCADGQMLKQIHIDFPDWRLYGVDADDKMIGKAMTNCGSAEYILSEEIPCDIIMEVADNAVFNLSSVIHEIYSYLSADKVSKFWNDLFRSRVKYIAIRDLMLGVAAFRNADINDTTSVLNHSDESTICDFCTNWGSLTQQNNLIHYLMKYRYKENWSREVVENYFPITVEQLLSIIPTERYKIVYFSHYILPYNRSKIFDDFGIELKDNTHVKILLERKER